MGKSSVLQLKSRGYIQESDLYNYKDLKIPELMDLLDSGNAYERTIAVRLISALMKDDEQKASLLCTKLSKEDKLYTKIELCDALAKMGVCAAKTMCRYLGRIGNNQYTELPEVEFKKKSYPLPRDIISRTLAHMGKEVLPYLSGVLITEDNPAIREAIDAVGFICFYEKIDYPLKDLIACFNINSDDKIIRWKAARALGSFSDSAAVDLLLSVKNCDNEERIRKEAERSLRIIQQRRAAPKPYLEISAKDQA